MAKITTDIIPEGQKKCSQCNKIRLLTEFHRARKEKDGRRSKCKHCRRRTEVLPPNTKRCKQCNEVKSITEFHKNRVYESGVIGYRPNCKPCRIIEMSKKYHSDEKFRKKKAKRYKQRFQDMTKEERDAYNEGVRDYLDKNPEQRKRNSRLTYEWAKNQLKNNPQYKLQARMRLQVYKAFQSFSQNGKIGTSRTYGIDYKAMINKLGERPLNHDMDHIIPQILFDHDDREQVRLCWSPENLQWLDHKENISKKDYISSRMEDYPPELWEHWKVAYKNYLDKNEDSD